MEVPEDTALTVRMTIGHLFTKKGADVFQECQHSQMTILFHCSEIFNKFKFAGLRFKWLAAPTKFIYTRGCAVTRHSPCASPRPVVVGPVPSPCRPQKSSNSSPCTGWCSMILYTISGTIRVQVMVKALDQQNQQNVSILFELCVHQPNHCWGFGRRECARCSTTGSGPVISIRSQNYTLRPASSLIQYLISKLFRYYHHKPSILNTFIQYRRKNL